MLSGTLIIEEGMVPPMLSGTLIIEEGGCLLCLVVH